jgi:hypothetical protein
MTESSWPSPDTSRVVNDAQYERLALSYGAQAGLVGSPADTALIYGDSTGMQIKVRADRYACVRGYEWYSGATDFTKTITANSSGSTRIDLVVLRLSRTTWNVTVAVVNGTPGAGTAPNPTQNTGSTGVFELPLATVTVANAAATITAGNVTFLGVYLAGDGSGFAVGSTAALASIPGKYDGMTAMVSRSRFLYNGATWGLISSPPLFVRKTANETLSSNATSQDDDHLVLALEASATYTFFLCLLHNTMSAAGIRSTFTIPTGAALTRYTMGALSIGDGANTGGFHYTQWNLQERGQTSSPGGDHSTGGLSQATAYDQPHIAKGYIIVGSTAGNLRVRWAQGASSGTTTTVYANSWLEAIRVA